jgi:zinc transporter 1/2/3
MPLHVAAVFIILVTSGLGVLLPIISAWFRRHRQPSDSDSERSVVGDSSADFGKSTGWWGNVFFIARHFGTGIILSTAFIHLLFHGFVMFQNECVGHMQYEATAPAISLAAAFITFLFDFVGGRVAAKQHTPNGARPHPHSHSHSHAYGGGPREKHIAPESPTSDTPIHATTIEDPHGHHIDAAFAAEQNWQVLLLEAGIIFHSIMIGVTLGAGSGNGWTTLFIVIIFHQIFEGLALGARIAVLSWITKTRALVMAAAFTLITPIGIAIGIAVRKSFSQNGKASLLSVGILNAISAGILLYTAFKLLAGDFTDGPLKRAKLGKVLVAMASLVVGMIAMSVLGKWA